MLAMPVLWMPIAIGSSLAGLLAAIRNMHLRLWIGFWP